MLTNIHIGGRVLIVLVLLLTGLAVGFIFGLRTESDRRDAIELKQQRANEGAFQTALLKGRLHAESAIKWQRRARIYSRNLQERIAHETSKNLAHCETQSSAQSQTGDVVLSGTFISLYNAAWLPQLDANDTGRAAGEVIAAGTVTPAAVLDNTNTNASLCADDRKRLDELIDLLLEIR